VSSIHERRALYEVASFLEQIVERLPGVDARTLSTEIEVLGQVKEAPDALTEIGLPHIDPRDYGVEGTTSAIITCSVPGAGRGGKNAELYIVVYDSDFIVTVDISSIWNEKLGLRILTEIGEKCAAQGLETHEMYAPSGSSMNGY